MTERILKKPSTHRINDGATAPIFFVLAEIGAQFEDRSFEPAEQWSDAFDAVAERLMELLDLGEVKSLPGYEAERGIVVRVESKGFLEYTPILALALDLLKENLKKLLVRALSVGGKKASGTLLDQNRGQLFAHVLLLDDLDAAKAYCAKAKWEEGFLPGKLYSAAFSEAKRLLSEVKQKVVARLQPALNAALVAMPHETHKQKQVAAAWVNAQLREIGLAIRCPNTGRPAILVVDERGGEYNVSRFRLQIRDEQGHTKRTWSTQDVPTLQLMEDVPREEPLAGWAERVRLKTREKRRH